MLILGSCRGGGDTLRTPSRSQVVLVLQQLDRRQLVMTCTLCLTVRSEKGPLDHQLLISVVDFNSRLGQRQIMEIKLHGLSNAIDELQTEPAVIFIRHLDSGDARVRADLLNGPWLGARRQSSLF